MDRESGRPRGFGFVTYADHRAMEDAIRDMDGRELDGRVISVNKAKPKMGSEDPIMDYERDHMSAGRDSFTRGFDRSAAGRSDCYNCGRPGHFARECPLADGNGGRFSSRQFSGGGGGGSRGGGDRFGMDRYEGRFEGGHYRDRDHHYGSGDNYYNNDRYSSGRDHFNGGGDRFMDREPPFSNAYGKQTVYGRDRGPRGGGERFGNGGLDRFDRGSFRYRVGPYDRPRRGGPHPSYGRY